MWWSYNALFSFVTASNSDWTGSNWIGQGLDWIGLDWTGIRLDWIGQGLDVFPLKLRFEVS